MHNLFLTRFADAQNIDRQPLHKKAAGEAMLKVGKTEEIGVYIGDRFTFSAHQVMVHGLVGLDAHGTMVNADLVKDATLDEQVDILVNSGQGDRRNAPLDPRIDLFRAGMTVDSRENLVDHLPLVGNGKTGLFAHSPKLTYFVLSHPDKDSDRDYPWSSIIKELDIPESGEGLKLKYRMVALR